MRRILIVFLFMVSAVAFGCQEAPQWIRYTSTEGRYGVLLPGSPQFKSQEEATADGGKIQQYLAFASDPGGAGYIVAYFDTGDRAFSFDKGRDGALSRVRGTLISERNISLRGYPGREVKLFGRTPSDLELFLVVRFYQVDRRIFIVQFIAPKSSGQELPDTAVKFFDSFHVETN